MVRFKRLLGVIAAGLIAAMAIPLPTVAATKAKVAANYGKLPLIFEANRGQTDARVKFLSRGPGYTLFLTESEAVLSLRGAGGKGRVLRVKLLGAEAAPKMTGLDRLPGISNYFIGRDRSKWQTGVPHYAKVGYEGVYPGIDLVFYGSNQRQLEYDFIVAPGADPARIKLAIEGAKRLEIAKSGGLIAHLAGGEVRFKKPVIYQEADGAKRRPVAGGYALKNGRVTFEISAYDRTKPLVIDPVLEYATYLGGNSYDDARGIAVDAQGNAHVTGTADSTDFPVTAGAFDVEHGGGRTVFVTKLNATGTNLIYSTFLGGNSGENAFDIAVDAVGNAYVTGSTNSDDFPKVDAFQDQLPTNSDGEVISAGFVTKFDPAGGIVYSTYFDGSTYNRVSVKPGCPGEGELNCLIYVTGGTFLKVLDPGIAGPDGLVSQGIGTPGSPVSGMAVDGSGAAYITGGTTRNDFPTTLNAMDTNCAHDEVDDDCGGGSGGAGDAFVTVLRPNDQGGFDRVYSTFLGGAIGASSRDIAIMPGCMSGCLAFVTGSTRSVDFPTTASAIVDGHTGSHRVSDTFVTVINTAVDNDPTNDLVYSTLFGGQEGMGIAADDAGRAYVAGGAAGVFSGEVPIRDAIQPAIAGRTEVFVAIIDTTKSGANSLLFSTYLGGSADEGPWGIAADGSGAAYVTGGTWSEDFPTTDGAFQESLALTEVSTKRGPFKPSKQEPKPTSDAFVLKIAGLFPATGVITPIFIPTRPEAVDDIPYVTNEDTLLEISMVEGVLVNDFDFEGNPVNPSDGSIVTRLVRAPRNGAVGLGADGRFVYTPNADFTGRDHFAYAAFDGQAMSNVAVAVIDVEPVNDPPVAQNDFYLVVEGTTLEVAAPGVLSNDSDPEGNSLTTATLVPGTGPALAQAFAFNADGSFTYTAGTGFAEADTIDRFTYTASDGTGSSAPARVDIVIGDGSIHVANLASQATKEGRTWTAHVWVWFHDSKHRDSFRYVVTQAVDGEWSGAPGTPGPMFCSLEQCQQSFSGIPNGVASVTFRVINVVHGNRDYAAGANNHDVDGDSDGTTVTVFK